MIKDIEDTKVEEIDRSLVAIFDIVRYSEKNPKTQAKLVGSFIKELNEGLHSLEKIKPDAFSTGDGAIVTIGKNCKLDPQTTKMFMDFVIDFSLNLLKKGLSIRTAVNYSYKEWAILIDSKGAVQGKYIQTGDTINIAARVLSFCEPREIMIHEDAYNFLNKMDLGDKYPLFRNKPVKTKHGVTLKTYSYDPPEDQKDYFYSPHSPAHDYKEYLYFPPIKSSIIKCFMDQGLEFELRNVISNAFESMRELNATSSFVSHNNVLDVLMQLTYDHSDSVYILSRNDRLSNFWTQPRKEKYIDYLESRARSNGGHINQTRLMVYSNFEREKPLSRWAERLRDIHDDGTFFTGPTDCLLRFRKLERLIFGVTLSKKYKYAIIPMPVPESMGLRKPKLKDIGDSLHFLDAYEADHGPMRAIITADKKYVEELIKDFEKLLNDPQVRKLK